MSARGATFKERFGPWALVTGASDGIGREFARELAARGLNLILAARREKELRLLAEELAREHGIESGVVACDLGREEEVARLLSATADRKLGLVVAAAGFGTSGAFADSCLEDELEMLSVNCRAVLRLTRYYAESFSRQRSGGIVLMGSLVGFQGVPRAAHYAATKAYVQTFAEGLARELAPFGVSVISSAPGPVRSGFGARAGMRMGLADDPQVVARGTLDALGRAVTVRPGFVSKLLGWSLATLPRSARTRILEKVMADMTSQAR